MKDTKNFFVPTFNIKPYLLSESEQKQMIQYYYCEILKQIKGKTRDEELMTLIENHLKTYLDDYVIIFTSEILKDMFDEVFILIVLFYYDSKESIKLYF